MVQAPKQGELFPEMNALDGTTLVNARCLARIFQEQTCEDGVLERNGLSEKGIQSRGPS